MRRSGTALLAAVLLWTCGGAVATAEASTGSGVGKSCDDAVYRVNGNVYAQTYDLRVRRLSCRSARRVALRWIRDSEGASGPASPYGYRCRRSDEVVITCRKGRRVAYWYTINRFDP